MTNTSTQNTFLYGANAAYVAEIYQRYMQNPGNVDASWASFFKALNDNDRAVLADFGGASWNKYPAHIIGAVDADAKPAKKAKGEAAPANDEAILDSLRARALIRAFRVRGHLQANLDPLGLMKRDYQPDLDPATYGFSDSDYDRPIFLGGDLPGVENVTLRQILEILRATYSGSVGVEFMHIQDPLQRAWIQSRIESRHNYRDDSIEGKKATLEKLTAGEIFEKFLHTKYTGTKRFGLEGGESLIPALETVLQTSAKLGVGEAIFGMAHRGRLSTLINILAKPLVKLLAEFEGRPASPTDVQGSGDVKYHLGTSNDRPAGGAMMHVSLLANPSHLEAVNPVVMGKVRAKQDQRGDQAREKVMGILLHGDAAFAGQGVVPECLMMAELPGYRIGGILHIIINNQIGFTTSPNYGRSSPYSSDVAKMIQAPIFHVNGDDPEAVVYVAQLASEYRHAFKHDVVVDMICYRRHGHNETDEPAFTQPVMYKQIAQQKTARTKYAEQLVAEGALSQEEADQMVAKYHQWMEKEQEAAKSYKPNKADWLEGAWSGMKTAPSHAEKPESWYGKTGVAEKTLQKIGAALTSAPKDFNLNSKIARQLEQKKSMFKSGEGFDWATAEALAFGSLAAEGFRVRLSGQDVGRGTFSQRHAILHDQENQNRYLPLQNIDPNQASVEVVDSPLSEYGVMGFDYGYSLADPKALVCWEAQFGDFSNGAQIIIDQFISSSESKWLRMSGLTLLLPHGYEGQGPEHSSCRLERYLQLCAEDNMQVANCSTPANYFHILRRQMKRDFRKPLIIATPKSLLRHKLCVSKLSDMAEGTSFQPVLAEIDQLDAAKIKRVVLCTGKIYYDLYEARAAAKISNVALLRVEQLYPWPEHALVEILKPYKAAEFAWCQEEPQNMGAWTYLDRRLERTLAKLGAKNGNALYLGRPEAASPAVGYLKKHEAEQKALLEAALKV